MGGKINELVTDEALAKLDKLIADLAIANRSMADAIQLANQYTAAIGGSKNLAEFVANQEKAAVAIKKVQEKINETRVAEQNLSEEREKLTKKQIEDERKLQELAEKRKRIVTEGTTSEIAAYEKARQGVSSLTDATNANSRAQSAAAAAATAASAANQRYGEQSAKTAQQVNTSTYTLQSQAKTLRELAALQGQSNAGLDNSVKSAGAATTAINTLKSALRAFGITLGLYQLVQWAKDLYGIAKVASGVEMAFARLGDPSLLGKLREQTKGFISDLDLESQAVRANNFNIPLEKLGVLLQFANARAKDTGESVDKLTNDIISGLGRKSTRIIDNLGISAIEVQKEFKKVGDFTVAVTNIIERNMDSAGAHVDTLADKANKVGVSFANMWKNVTGFLVSKNAPETPDDDIIGKLISNQTKQLDIKNKTDVQVNATLDAQTKKVRDLSKAYLDATENIKKLKSFGGAFAPGVKDDPNGQNAKNVGEQLVAAEEILKRLREEQRLRINNARIAKGQVSVDELQIKVTELKEEAESLMPGFSLGKDGKLQTEKDRQSILEEARTIQAQIDKILGKGAKQAAKQLNNDELELQKERLIGARDAAKLILDDETKSYEERYQALRDFVEKSRLLVINEKEIADRAPGITSVGKKVNTQKAKNENTQIDHFEVIERQRIDAEIIANEKKFAKDIVDEYEALEKRKENLIESGFNQQLLDNEYANSEEILQLTKKYEKGEVAEKEYRRRLKALQKDSAAEAVDIQIKALEEILEAQELANTQASELGIKFNVDTQPTKNNITKLKIKSNQLKTGSDSDNALGDKAKAKQDAEEILATSALAIQGLNIIGDLIKANAQAKIDVLEREFDLIQRNADSEKERINDSLLSNKEKARQTNLIDAQTAQQRARITQEENEIKKKQAQYDKANAIANIIQNTAVAYVKVLGQTGIFGIALAPVVAALGAAQLALAIATPLPQFYKGTKNAPEGFAHVGERGTELQINPDGTMGLTPNKDTITYLQRGTQIIPHDELIAMVAKPESVQYVGGMQMDNKKLEKLMEENNELQKRKPATVVKVIADKWGTYANRNY